MPHRDIVVRMQVAAQRLGAGGIHSLVLLPGGSVKCLGDNAYGQAPPARDAEGPCVAVSAGVVLSGAVG